MSYGFEGVYAGVQGSLKRDRIFADFWNYSIKAAHPIRGLTETGPMLTYGAIRSRRGVLDEKTLSTGWPSLIVFGIVAWVPSVFAQTDFYKGKTITVYIGTTPGALYDQWGRILAQHMGKHIPGKPDMIVQNMPGAGHMIAANYVYNKTKPDGLSLIGSIVPTLYFDQLVGRKEAQYDWAKFVWIGSPVQGESQMYMRADTPYKTIEDVRSAKEPPRCGAQGTSDSAYYLPKLFEETIGTKFNLVQGYPGGPEIDFAVERGEIHCRAFTIEAFMSREPYHTWRKKGFRAQYHSNRKEKGCETAGNADAVGIDGPLQDS